MTRALFADRAVERSRKLLCPVIAGLDPRPELLSTGEENAAGNSPRRLAAAYRRFGETVLDGLVGVVPAVKIQIAFYEALGLPGVGAYAATVRAARERGLLVVGDVKRGDIGSTAEAYAEGHFGAAAHQTAADVDAVTLNPYLGRDSIDPFLSHCRDAGKGAFVLVRTSNPSAVEIQDLIADGRPIYRHVAALVDSWGTELRGRLGYSSVGAVVGATYPRELREIRTAHPNLLILVPGYGAQGGTASDVAGALDELGSGLLVASSRGILRAYRTAADRGASPSEGVRDAALRMRDEIWTAFRARDAGGAST